MVLCGVCAASPSMWLLMWLLRSYFVNFWSLVSPGPGLPEAEWRRAHATRQAESVLGPAVRMRRQALCRRKAVTRALALLQAGAARSLTDAFERW